MQVYKSINWIIYRTIAIGLIMMSHWQLATALDDVSSLDVANRIFTPSESIIVSHSESMVLMPIAQGFVWDDTNGNGLQDIGEPGMDGVRVGLYLDANNNGIADPISGDVEVDFTITAVGGRYEISDFPLGNYFIVFSNFPSGYNLTHQNVGPDDSIDSDEEFTPVMSFMVSGGISRYDLGLYNGMPPPLIEICDNSFDDDNDGLIDCYDCLDCGSGGLCADWDGDLVADSCDEDDDNDGIFDVLEGCICEDLDISSLDGLITTVAGFNNELITLSGAVIQMEDPLIFGGNASLDVFTIDDTHETGNHGIQLGVVSAGVADYMEVRYTFSQDVCNFNARILDIDSSEALSIFGYKDGVEVAYNVNYQGSCVSFDLVNTFSSACLLDARPAASNVDNHAINIEFTDCIDSLRIRSYENGTQTGGAYTFVISPFPTCTYVDTDNDGDPDCRDLDSDGDGCLDTQEAIVSDIDEDGMAGSGIPTVNSQGRVTSITYSIPATADWQNGSKGLCLTEICSNGIDDDADGLLDCLDDDCIPVVSYNQVDDVTCVTSTSVTLTEGSPVGGTYTGDGVVGGIFDPSLAGIGTHLITYTYTDASTCTNSAVDTIIVLAIPVVSLNDPDDFCAGDIDMDFIGQPTDSNGSFTTTAASGLIDNGDGTATLDVSVSGSGTYDVTYVYRDLFGCADSAMVSVLIYDELIADVGSNQNICKGESIPLSTSVSGGDGTYSYAWSPSTGLSATDIANPVASPTESTNYTVLVTDGNGCTDSDRIRVRVNELPRVTIINTVPCEGDDMMITSTVTEGRGPYVYSWTGPAGFTSTASDPIIPNFQDINEGFYYVQVVDANLCVAIDSVFGVVCLDIDDDGVANSFDLDDDNDGILDFIECPNTGPNLVVNGDFEDAYAHWASDFNRGRNNNGPTSGGCGNQGWVAVSPCASANGTCPDYYNYNGGTPDGSVLITDPYGTGDNVLPTTNCNTTRRSCQAQISPDHTTGTGFSVYIDPSDIPGKSYWKQSININANTNYRFSAWIMVIEEDPNLVFKINGGAITNDFNLDRQTPGNGDDVWQEVTTIWSSRHLSGPLVLELVNNTAGCAGNDIRLDDVFFAEVLCDTDMDGIDDFEDLDSDNDGILDLIEAGHGFPAGSDGRIDGSLIGSGPNGLFDGVETTPGSNNANYTVRDSEITPDGFLDPYELDSDGDGCFDAFEAGVDDIDEDGIAGTGLPLVSSTGLVTSINYSFPPNFDWTNPSINGCAECVTATTNPHVMYLRKKN